MPVDSLHPQYVHAVSDWKKCRDAFNGGRAIKAAGKTYLPMLGGQTTEEYDAYKERALFYGITAKTISAMVGMAMNRSPSIKYTPKLERFFKDSNGIQFYELLKRVLVETLLVGRFGALIDRPVLGGDIMIVPYLAENIINWVVNDYGQPEMVVLSESYYEHNVDDEFTFAAKTRWRVLRIVNGIYTVRIYDDTKNMVEEIVPRLNGRPLDFIPFYMLSPSGRGWEMERSPLLDIVDINISHYRSSADLEHGRHWTGLPTPVVTGADADITLRIGSQTAWVIPNEKAHAYMLEFNGLGLQSLERAMTEKQSQLASMSARLMDNSSRGSESGDVVKLRYMSETASLTDIVRAVEAFMMAVYARIAEFEGDDASEISIVLNKEFLNTRLTGAELEKLFSGFHDGSISASTLVFNLRRGDVLPADKTDDEEIIGLEQRKSERIAEQAKINKPSSPTVELNDGY